MPRRKLLASIAILPLLAVIAYPFTKAHLQALAILKQVGNQPVPLARRQSSLRAHRHPGHPTPRQHPRPPLHPHPPPQRPSPHRPPRRSPPRMNEPRLEAFAAAMASCGLRVLTPELPGIKDYHVDTSSIRVIGESTQWFAAQTHRPVGVMGLSFSGGLALVAASDPVYRPDFKFVLAVGSQDSMSRVEQYYRHRTGDASRRLRRTPDPARVRRPSSSSMSTSKTSSPPPTSKPSAPSCASTSTRTKPPKP